MIKETTDGHRLGGGRRGLEHRRQQNHYPLTPPSPRGEREFTKIKATKEKITKPQRHNVPNLSSNKALEPTASSSVDLDSPKRGGSP